MVGIVAMHCGTFSIQGGGQGMLIHDPVELFTVQLWKFASLCFFMISGFLLGDKLAEYDPVVFFKRRVDAIGKPWTFWAGLLFVMLSVHEWLKTGSPRILQNLAGVVLHSEYWFVPNFLTALGILILGRKHLDKAWFGGLLLALSLFYAANQYLRILPTVHTTAILGFVFWLWLGYQFQRNQLGFIRWLRGLSTPIIMVWCLVAYALACTEALHINQLAPEGLNSFDTLRLSNMFYGLGVFLLLERATVPLYPRFINPRTDTFGIYLSHWIYLTVLGNLLIRFLAASFHVDRQQIITGHYTGVVSEPLRFALWIVMFVVLYGSALLTTQLLGRTRFYRLAGMTKQVERQKPVQAVVRV